MKKILILSLFLLVFISISYSEDKPGNEYIIPEKLTAEEIENGPTLSESHVYPLWGQVCTNYTYMVTYKDEKGREPEYVRVRLNNEWHDMNKQSGTPETGELYTYNYIPNSGKINWYYFEASNGAGKARAGIIDSPDQGPVIYSEKFDNNEIILLNKEGKELWSYSTGYDAVSQVAISKNGEYVAAVTTTTIYLFSIDSNIPLWTFCTQCNEPLTSVANYQGVAISSDGNYIAGSNDGKLYFFEKDSNKPLWNANIESSPIGIDMSDDGEYIAAGIANAGEKGDKIFFFNKQGEILWEYKASHPDYVQTGNFYKPDMTPDGEYVAVSTGCPDRRAYLFSKTGEIVFRSEMLTEDSPVHKSAISDSGNLIAYSLDHNVGKDILILFNKEGNEVWSFSSENDCSARAVSISSDGTYIAIGTSAGHIYLFNKNSNKPLWEFTATGGVLSGIGDVKLSSNGDFLVAGSVTKKIYFFEKKSNGPLWTYNANTWVNTLDFNDEYILAGTGLMEYLFEGNDVSNDEVECKEIIQPPPMQTTIINTGEGSIENAVCGNNKCESFAGENNETCPSDCMPIDDNLDDSEGGAICGDGICGIYGDFEETELNCPSDCSSEEISNKPDEQSNNNEEETDEIIEDEEEIQEESQEFDFTLIGILGGIIILGVLLKLFIFKK